MPIHLPQINYIIFQLVSFSPENPSDIREEKVLSLAVIPTMIDYTFTSRDALYQTAKTIFTDKFPIAPVRCVLSGNTGQMPRLESLSFLDGFGRLKELELLFRQSHSTDDDQLFQEFLTRQGLTRTPIQTDFNWIQGKPIQRVYGLNYYDFIWQQFFAVNLQTFHFYGNARINTIMKFYDLQFLSSGAQYQLQTSDPLLIVLTKAMDILTSSAGYVNDALTNLANNEYVKRLAMIGAGVMLAKELSESTKEMVELMGQSVYSAKTALQELVPVF